jgi:hypothetical protein
MNDKDTPPPEKSDLAIAIDEIQTEREDREEAEAERLHNLSLKDPS